MVYADQPTGEQGAGVIDFVIGNDLPNIRSIHLDGREEVQVGLDFAERSFDHFQAQHLSLFVQFHLERFRGKQRLARLRFGQKLDFGEVIVGRGSGVDEAALLVHLEDLGVGDDIRGDGLH